MAFLLCHVLVNTSNFPTILPTNAPNLRKTSRYILKQINTRRTSNPLQHKGSRGLTWHEWVRHKRIHGFLVRMRSAVRIRPAAPKSIESFGFRCFFCCKNALSGVGQNVEHQAQAADGGAAESRIAEDVLDDALTGFRIVARFARKTTAFEMIFLLFPAAQNMCQFALPLGICRVNRTSL